MSQNTDDVLIPSTRHLLGQTAPEESKRKPSSGCIRLRRMNKEKIRWVWQNYLMIWCSGVLWDSELNRELIFSLNQTEQPKEMFLHLTGNHRHEGVIKATNMATPLPCRAISPQMGSITSTKCECSAHDCSDWQDMNTPKKPTFTKCFSSKSFGIFQ